MRKVFLYLLTGFVLLSPVSCKKDDPAPAGPTLPTTPEAKAEHDDKSGGIYKGTFANPTNTGTIKIVLQEGKTEIILVLNGVTKTLTTSGLASWTSGQDIVNVLFANGNWQVTFTVAGDASSLDMAMSLDGQTSYGAILNKETSTQLVKVYEGTYAGDDSGKWNFTLQSDQLYGIYSGGGSTGAFEGTLTGTAIAITSSGSSVTAAGTMAGEGATCSGTWTSSSSSGTWTGKRSL